MDLERDARATAERYRDAWLAGDLAAVVACYADDLTLHYFGNNPFTGDHVGKDAALTTLIAIAAKTPRELVAIDEVLAGPGSAVVVARERLTIDGTSCELRRLFRYRVENGRFTECWVHDEDQDLLDRAWSA
jgi:hypothetical protein